MLTLALIYISIMTKDAEQIFGCLFAEVTVQIFTFVFLLLNYK